jgi:hypothetical protein
VVFRLVSNGQPTGDDFLSDEAEGRIQNLARSGSMAIYRGFSVRATLAQARSLARSLQGRTGQAFFVAEVPLDWSDGDAIARTFPASPGHHTVWAHPDLISQRVTQVHPV